MAEPGLHQAAIDGAKYPEPPIRKATASPPREDMCCIFVHAGAGYHSIQNENIHLEACNDAAQVAMLVLRNGGTALNAVEMAVKMLEDREITNAGYGSNLAMDGVVECDASIVDHHGRSGAVGAVAQIKNPISLARLVLEHTMHTLTLRRVPPNLLVSQGATEFAYEMGMQVLPYDALVSPAARDRWLRWRSDLKSAERRAKKSGHPPSSYKIRKDPGPGEEAVRQRMRQQHERSMLKHNPSSPTRDRQSEGFPTTSSAEDTPPLTGYELSQSPDLVAAPGTITEASRSAFMNSTQKVPTLRGTHEDSPLRNQAVDSISEEVTMQDGSRNSGEQRPSRRSQEDGSSEDMTLPSASAIQALRTRPLSTTPVNGSTPDTPTEMQLDSPPSRTSTTPDQASDDGQLPPPYPALSLHPDAREDDITDTVGAIAVDSWGNIACGASSGGIGMKYRGRVGPAALVGIGAAVIPVDPDDSDRTCVATVTSGTGEHMATTMAATVCAERLYKSVRKSRGGSYEEVTEDQAIKAMIENDFMGHPSVRNSNSAGAIGILGVKQVREGVFFYFAHNTDSFAMASMHSDEDAPWCAMSRSKGSGQIAQGGRMLRYNSKRRKTSSRPERNQPPTSEYPQKRGSGEH
ncbi:N-terminal nucleophile aminohydrolase [Sporormia fimetaria CBS 119925]|uniref:N-terminal nucleophile aminohydrolase n=1 Tax=Sporormia fimetaria CBS 119925 TaxID=1340428 RepID=A0A6A6VAW7_9PLEO|nr:N-terminal nucleophile aminohydrolase [Sporormia fimetaria CBS 119925]